MASRILRDGLLDSEPVSTLHDRTFRLYIHLLLAADDYGLVAIGYGPIKRAAPLMDWNREIVAKMLGELTDAGLIIPYSVDGKQFAAIAKWKSAINSLSPKHAMPPFGMGHVVGVNWYKSKEIREAASKILNPINTGSFNRVPPEPHQPPTGVPPVKAEVREKRNTTAEKSAKCVGVDSEFETMWAKYPKRLGDNPKTRAMKAWKARIAEGHTAEEIISGVIRYAEYATARGIIGSEFVKQAATFMGQDKGFLETWSVPDDRHGTSKSENMFQGAV